MHRQLEFLYLRFPSLCRQRKLVSVRRQISGFLRPSVETGVRDNLGV